jgi:hypothetical protein
MRTDVLCSRRVAASVARNKCVQILQNRAGGFFFLITRAGSPDKSESAVRDSGGTVTGGLWFGELFERLGGRRGNASAVDCVPVKAEVMRCGPERPPPATSRASGYTVSCTSTIPLDDEMCVCQCDRYQFTP